MKLKLSTIDKKLVLGYTNTEESVFIPFDNLSVNEVTFRPQYINSIGGDSYVYAWSLELKLYCKYPELFYESKQ